MIAFGVGGVGRHRDAAGGHDRQIGNAPFGAVFGHQHHPVAVLQAQLPQRLGKAATRRAVSVQLSECHSPSFFAHRKGASPRYRARARNIDTRLGKAVKIVKLFGSHNSLLV